MPARKPRPKGEKPQFERFLETVHKVEADETDETLDRVIGKIASSTIHDAPSSERRGTKPLKKSRV
jgi:hypothetical protein